VKKIREGTKQGLKQYQEYDAEHRIQNAGCRNQHRTDEPQATKDRCVAQARAMSKVQSSSKPSTTLSAFILLPCRHSPGTHVLGDGSGRNVVSEKKHVSTLVLFGEGTVLFSRNNN